MKIESEKVLEKKLAKEVKDRGGWSIKLLSDFIKGLPDRMVLVPGGKIYFAEIKTTGKKPTKMQILIHKKLERLGFKVYIIDDSEKIKKFIDGTFN